MAEQEPCIEVGHAVRREPRGAGAGEAAAREALTGLRVHRPSAALVFASVQHDLPGVLRGVRRVLGDVPVIGSSTAGEICDGVHQGSVVVTVLASPHLSVALGVGENVAGDWSVAVAQALAAPAVSPYFDSTSTAWQRLTQEGKGAFAFVLSPGATRAAETRSFPIVETVKRRALGQLPIFGMSASDEMRFEQNFVLAGDRAVADGLLVAVFETRLRFGMAVAHGMHPTGPRLRVTAADEHEVLELEGRLAADVYAELIGVPRSSLDGVFVARATRTVVGMPGPLGSFIPNAATWVTPRGGLRFAIPVPPGQVLSRLEADEATSLTAGPEALSKASARAGTGRPALAVVGSCAIRPLLLGDAVEAEVPSMVRVLGGTPLVGFVSCGEAGLADDGVPQHMNAVISALVVADELSQPARVARENQELRERTENLRRQRREELERTVSERTAQLQAANARLQAEIETRTRMTAQLMQADRLVSMGTLAAGVGHEINNPLAYASSGVQALTELVSGGLASGSPAQAEAQAILREVGQGLERIRQAVRDLKLFSRGGDDTRHPVEMQAVLESTLHMAHNDIRHRARLVRAYGPTPVVSANESRLGQVFLNLIVNASQSIPDGAADVNEIRVATFTDGRGWAAAEIRDTGAGIAAGDLARIFEPFFTTKPLGEGTGLGLAICRNTVASMGGEITVESERGKGSTFRVFLPPMRPEERPAGAPAPPPRGPGARRGRILVVDDDPLVARSMKRMLAREHDVVIETSARVALSRFHAGEEYDVVLCDVMMPQMSGPEFHGELGRLAPEQARRVVFVTGGAFTASTSAYLEKAGLRTLEKPFEAEELRNLVRGLM